jgi:hypothetical protein
MNKVSILLQKSRPHSAFMQLLINVTAYHRHHHYHKFAVIFILLLLVELGGG